MTTGLVSNCRCVHCLRISDFITADHVFPSSWYPDTTPTTVQRWTVPCCSECNQELGKLERDLLVRLILCVDPKSSAVSGLASKALRSLGIDATGLSEREKSERQKLRDKIRSELIPRADLMTKPGEIPGLGPPQASMSAWSIPVPWAGLDIIAEKIVRGCEHKLKGRFVEAPYGMRIFIGPTESVPEPYASASRVYELGPGCNVRRIFATEDPECCPLLDLRMGHPELQRQDRPGESTHSNRPELIPGRRNPRGAGSKGNAYFDLSAQANSAQRCRNKTRIMTAKDERARGVEILTEILSGNRILRVKEPRTFHNGYSYYFEVTAYDKVTDFCLPAEVLEDMEGTPEYKQHADKFARAIERRMSQSAAPGFHDSEGRADRN